MLYNEKKLILKDGREAAFRSPLASDAPERFPYEGRSFAQRNFNDKAAAVTVLTVATVPTVAAAVTV